MKRFLYCFICVFAVCLSSCISFLPIERIYHDLTRNIDIEIKEFHFIGNEIIIDSSRNRHISYETKDGELFITFHTIFHNPSEESHQLDLNKIIVITKSGKKLFPDIAHPGGFGTPSDTFFKESNAGVQIPMLIYVWPKKTDWMISYIFEKMDPPVSIVLFGDTEIPLTYSPEDLE